MFALPAPLEAPAAAAVAEVHGLELVGLVDDAAWVLEGVVVVSLGVVGILCVVVGLTCLFFIVCKEEG